MSAGLSDSELREWYAFIRAHNAVIGRLGADLEREHGMSIGYYEVLLALSRTPERRLRMSELARAVFLSPSGLTRLVDRLARDGLVERRPCDSDARAIYAAMTDRGEEIFRCAARTHVRGIREYFLDRLAPTERGALRRSLEALSRRD